jgi:hypothetical protein
MAGLFWLTLSIFVCVRAIREGFGTFGTPGPGFFPFWAGVFLGVLAILLRVEGIFRRTKGRNLRDLWKGVEWRKPVWVLMTLFIYGILLPRLGYLIATVGLLAFLFGIRRVKLWVRLVSATITALASYVIFYICLGVELPRGIFGF